MKIILNLYYSPVQQLKDIIQQNKNIYIPINGGSSLINEEWCKDNLLFDNTGENISDKNRLLNEFTSIYWVWKNYDLTKEDYIGFNHYRRFFKLHDISDYYKYDIIISKPIFSSDKYSLSWQYRYYHRIEDLQTCIDTIREMHGKDYGDKMKEYFNTNGTNFAPCNMFLMKKDLFGEWCNFIFPVLFELEKKICTTEEFNNRDNYQKRALCFLSERLFNFWCYEKLTNGVVIKEIDMVEKLDFKPQKINERGDFS